MLYDLTVCVSPMSKHDCNTKLRRRFIQSPALLFPHVRSSEERICPIIAWDLSPLKHWKRYHHMVWTNLFIPVPANIVAHIELNLEAATSKASVVFRIKAAEQVKVEFVNDRWDADASEGSVRLNSVSKMSITELFFKDFKIVK